MLLSLVLHPIEKAMIKILRETQNQTPEEIAEKTNLAIDQIRRGIEWLRLKNLATVLESEKSLVSLGKNGLASMSGGLPERKLVNLIRNNPMSFEELRKKLLEEINIAIANAKRNDWINIQKGETSNMVSIKKVP